jgi:putative flippase GtrA
MKSIRSNRPLFYGQQSGLASTLFKHGPEFIRFVFVGAVNSLITYVMYVALVFVVPYPVAYSISYVAGILISYYLNCRFVFKEKLRLSKALQFPLVYFFQYLLGIGLLFVLVSVAKIDKLLAPIGVVVITVPITYLLSRYVIKEKPAPAGGERHLNRSALRVIITKPSD